MVCLLCPQRAANIIDLDLMERGKIPLLATDKRKGDSLTVTMDS